MKGGKYDEKVRCDPADCRDAAGLRVLCFCGDLPDHPQTATLFLFAAMEALTNAVRHADARCLHFEITQTEGFDMACFANDGNIPTAPVTEGGGLGSLRRKTELAGGSMTIETKPAFALVITVPCALGYSKLLSLPGRQKP